MACGGEAFESVSGGETGGAPGTGGHVSAGGAPSSGGTTSNSGGSVASGGATSAGGSAGGGVSGGSGGPSTGTYMWASSYDQSCQWDYECLLVTEGDACGCNGACENAAINNGASMFWQSDLDAIECSPAEPGEPGEVCTAGCAQMLAACAEGTCGARPPLYIDAAQFERTCQTDDDCVLIFTGEVCSSCQCGGSGVNHAGYERYLELVHAVQCSPGPSACDCAGPTTVSCFRNDPMQELGVCDAGY